ncbi:MAG: Abi family protein [Bacteroides graminisolvens]|nr:Abi family protein [Bacteroides graminisolvens]
MKTNFTKHYSSPSQVIQILKSRGMVFSDDAKAERYLTNISYHRLSAYIFPFYQLPKSDLTLKDGTNFTKALTLYRFDKKLRILLFNEIEKLEVSVRSVLANFGCQELQDDFWITNSSYFANAVRFKQTLSVIDKEIDSSKEDYIEDFRASFVESYPPAWMITEVLSFGSLNYIYSNIASNQLRKQIADYFGVKPKIFVSWLTVLSNLRNMCCHHARVWNRDFVLKPAEPRKLASIWTETSKLDDKRIYYRLCIIKYLLNTISPNNDLCNKLNSLFAEFPQVDAFAMGFPVNWDKRSPLAIKKYIFDVNKQ